MATTGPRLVSEAGDNAKARDQLIEAASQIMREGDTIDLSLSELSLRAGLNSALVKYYFGNKNGLMLALLDRDMGNIVHSLEALVAKDIADFRDDPRDDAAVAFQAERNVVGWIQECEADWCRLSVDGEKGWVRKSALWGVDAGEVIE